MAKRPTKAQKEKQELLNETMSTVLAAGAQVLQRDFYFSDKQSGIWILKTSRLLAEHIGTEKLQNELDAMISEAEHA